VVQFLIDRQGKVVQRFGPTEEPNAVAKAISKLL
jgi:glutathione peroxidase-family protein